MSFTIIRKIVGRVRTTKKIKLLKALKRSQKLTSQAIEVLRLAYRQDLESTAADEGAPGPLMPVPSVHDQIEPIKGDELLRYYR